MLHLTTTSADSCVAWVACKVKHIWYPSVSSTYFCTMLFSYHVPRYLFSLTGVTFISSRMRSKSVVSAKLVELVSRQITHASDNPIRPLDDYMIASSSSSSALYIYYRTISLRCHMRGLLDNGIYGVERCLKAMAHKALTRMSGQPPAFGGHVDCAIHEARFLWAPRRISTPAPTPPRPGAARRSSPWPDTAR